ncbi:MAG: carboxypeptidase regulatory-like domain-containing protein [Solirubrobacterales bacterium]
MSGFVNWMNSTGESFVVVSLRMLAQSGVLILIILVLDLLLRKRVRAVVRYWIWMLVLAKLLLPPSLSSPTSLAWWFGDRLPDAAGVVTEIAAEPEHVAPLSRPTPQAVLAENEKASTSLEPTTSPGAPVPSHADTATAQTQTAPVAATMTWQAAVLAAWLMVVVVMLVLLVQRALFVRGLVLQSQDAPDRLHDLLGHCRRRMKVRTSVRLRLTPVSASPSVCGLVRPTILIPERMLAQLDHSQLKSILLHELAHVKRADLWVNFAQTLLQIIYVYHPLVWLANTIIRRVREQAVDETVLAAMGDEAEEYPRTLLSVSKLAFDHPALSLRLVGVVESKRNLIARIRHITSRPFPMSAKLGFVGLAFVFTIAMTLLPMAGRTKASAATAPDQQTAPTLEAATTTLSGKVADLQGGPVAGADVTLYEAMPGELGVLPDIVTLDRTTSGADGAFTFAVAQNAWTYREGYVVIRKKGLASAWASWPMKENRQLSVSLEQPTTLAGEVVDEAGRPIADATIHISMAKIGKGENRRELRASGFFQTQTGRDGWFVFADMPAGATFEFFVEGAGRASINTLDISSYSREQCQFTAGRTDIRLTLPAEARIEGVVVRKPDGKLVGGVEIAAHADRRGSAGPIPSKRAVTAADGTFSIGNLAAGNCVVELWIPRGQDPEWVAEDLQISLKAGQTQADLRMELTKGAIIEALIRDPAGKPVEKVNAHFELIGQSQGFGERTDANGLARIRALPGTYRVAQIYRPGYIPPEMTDPVTVEEGQTKRVEFTVTPTPKVAGIVRDGSGDPLAGVKVQTTWIKMLSSCTSSAVSDASGKFDIEWDSGPFGQGASSIVFVARDPARNLAEVLDIDERTGPLDVKLKRGVIVTGAVLDPDGKPLAGANARILLCVSKATVRLGWDELATAGPDGVFEIKGIGPEREYAVEVFADGYGKKQIPIGLLKDQETRHDIGQVKLALSNLTISGLVVDPNDEPVAGAEVQAFGEGQPDLRTARTDAQGRFTVRGVSPGQVYLSVNPREQSALSGGTEVEAGATDVKIMVSQRRSAQASAKSISLKGKALPAMKDLGIDLPQDAGGKMLLVCFCDIDQRPSRNTMLQLVEQAKELTSRGIVIAAVQNSSVDETKLKEWIEQNKVPFPVGRIRTNENKTRSAWGVRSLPWLILTDRNHVVRAEGFDISRLQSEIEAARASATGAAPASTDTGGLSQARPQQAPAPAGVVVDEKGTPVAGARVLLYHKKNTWGLGNRVLEDTRTDAQGRFVLTSFPGVASPGNYLLFATHPDHAMAWHVISPGREQSECRLTMTEPATQTFRVTDHEGNPLTGARIWIHSCGRDDDPNPLLRPWFEIPENIGLPQATTDGQGQATVANLPRGRCAFYASQAGYSDRYGSVENPAKDEVHLELTRAATATGHVLTSDGKPVAGAEVWFEADWGEWYFDYAITDETGRFFNDAMLARGGSWVDSGGSGQYRVTIRHPDFTASEVTVQLEPGKTDDFNIEAVEGTLLRIRALEPETERPIAGARISGSSGSGRLDGLTDANGVFERRVLNGEASVMLWSPPRGVYMTQTQNRKSARATVNGGTQELTVYATSRLYPLVNLAGRLTLPDGSPAAGTTISTVTNFAYETATFFGASMVYARTNPDGSFKLEDLPHTAELLLFAEAANHEYVLAETLDLAQAGPELAKPLVMQKGQTASVVLRDKSGKPQANMPLIVLPRKWNNYLTRAEDRCATTDAEGKLTLDGVVPGLEYFIRDAKANLSQRGWWELYNENRVLLPSEDRSIAPAASAALNPV